MALLPGFLNGQVVFLLIEDTAAKEQAIKYLRNGGAIGIFPEGTRNRTDQFLLPFKFGAVSMAQKTKAKIVPFAITGEYKFRSKNLTVRFGEAFEIGDIPLEKANEKLTNVIASLKMQSLQDQKK